MSEARSSLISGMQVTTNVSLIKPLGAGGMGAVWLADHHGLKTRVVVKFMLGGLDSSANARLRFSREAMAAAQVKSPHVVQMLDHGVTEDGVPFIVMEHLEGHDLGVELERHGALSPAKVVGIIQQVAKALSKVHAAGLLHRDIKPDNIFLCSSDDDELFVKLLDFGIAKSNADRERDGTLDGETKTGQVVGTPYYMSPEQVTAQKVIDFRSDLWALAVVAYEALTATRPFDGPSFGALAVKIATGSPPKMTDANPELPVALDPWFAKACAREPQARFGSAKELAEALRACFEGVVSLPSGVMSDSGQRESEQRASASGPRSIDRSASGSPMSRSPSPTFALASTLEDSGDKPSLARSEPGSAALVVEERAVKGSSSKLVVGGAMVALVAVGAFFAFGGGSSRPTTGAGASTAGSSSGAAPTLTSAGERPIASAPASSGALAAPSASAMGSALVTGASASSATSAAPPATVSAVTASKPTGRPPVVVHPPTTSSKPHAVPDVPQKPPTKPVSSEPDLY